VRWLALVAIVLSGCVVLSEASGTPQATQTRPNIVVIETDDQTQSSLAYMPKTRALLAAQGVTFDNSFVSYSLCCPSRATFLTGEYAHNHGVLGNSPPAGGWEVFKAKHATNNLAVWLQRSGYYTALIGKFLNGYGRSGDIAVPPGWSEWHAGVDLSFLGGTMSDEGRLDQLPTTEEGYQTDVWSRMAQDVIRRRAASTQPFFLWLTPHVPHNGGPRDPDDPLPVNGKKGKQGKDNGGGTTRPPARYRDRFAGLALPKPPSFNEADVSDKPAEIRNLPLLTDQQIAAIREAYQQALEADLGVDDMVAAIVARLKETGELGNTLIIFTSDNGFFYGEHRVAKGKVRLYEPSIRVPLVVRGPGVPKALHLKQMAANIDLAPTIVDAANAKAGLTMDGRSLFTLFRNPKSAWRDALVIERGPAKTKKRTKARPGSDQVFTAIRTPRYLYARYDNGEQELYDLVRDPYELESRHSDRAYARVRATLAAHLSTLRNCIGAACWQH
jgi:N-acetylglucosamine-6-sulfatase